MDFSTLSIEIGAAVLGLFLLVLGIMLPPERKGVVGVAAIIGLLALLGLSLTIPGNQGSFFKGLYLNDGFARFFKQLFLFVSLRQKPSRYFWTFRT